MFQIKYLNYNIERLNYIYFNYNDQSIKNEKITMTIFEDARTEWSFVGSEHISIFEEIGLDKASNLIKRIMHSILESKPAEKFTLFDPIEELF